MSGDMKSVSELFSRTSSSFLNPLSSKEKWGCDMCFQGCPMLWGTALGCWGSDRV